MVQRHRARRAHYDLRLEIDGVLVSWAVPNGPTLDPAVKRLAVHVEDHPIEYLYFEGVIPRGQYGAGDVIVWDTGTWEPHGTDDPAAAVAAGDFHADVTGHKLRGRFVLVRRGGDGAGSSQWLLLHKADDDAVSGWDPETSRRRCSAAGPTNRYGPTRTGSGSRTGPRREASVELHPPPVAGPTDEELAALDELGAGGRWEVFGRELRLTNLDKELFPGRDGEPPVTKRELISYTARIAPVVLPYLAGRPLNMHRFPGGAAEPGFWHKQLPDHAPEWVPRWRNPEAKAGESKTYLVVDEPAALVWAANFGALEWHAWTARASDPASPSYALIDIDPGETTSWDDVLVLARLHRTALEHLNLRAAVKGHRSARHPCLDTGRRRAELPRHPHLGRAAVQDHRRDRARPGELGMGQARAGRAGPARLHPERPPQDPRRALQPARGAGRTGLGADRLGRTRRSVAAARRLHDPDGTGPRGRPRR